MVLIWETATLGRVNGGGFPQHVRDRTRRLWKKDLLVEKVRTLERQGELSRDFVLKWRWTDGEGDEVCKELAVSMHKSPGARFR